MAELSHAVLVAIGFLFMVCASSAVIVFGAGIVCRWMKWAPINITVNVNTDEARKP